LGFFSPEKVLGLRRRAALVIAKPPAPPAPDDQGVVDSRVDVVRSALMSSD